MSEIEKKVLPVYFQAILDGKKNFEFRLADWECKEGDTLILKEWDKNKQKYTGRELKRGVAYVAKFKIEDLFWPEKDIKKYGIQIISLKK